jgi:hypothetical protein
MKLFEIAHGRTGDKGNTANVSIIAFDKEDYGRIREKLTVEFLKDFYNDVVKGEIIRYELPQLGALNFVMHEALGGGVTRTLNYDAHGKSLVCYLLDIDI